MGANFYSLNRCSSATTLSAISSFLLAKCNLYFVLSFPSPMSKLGRLVGSLVELKVKRSSFKKYLLTRTRVCQNDRIFVLSWVRVGKIIPYSLLSLGLLSGFPSCSSCYRARLNFSSVNLSPKGLILYSYVPSETYAK